MNPLHQAAVRRKAYYFAAILVLFTVSMFWRGKIPVPLSSPDRAAAPPTALHGLADRVAARTIQSQADRYELWELDPRQGEAEIAGSAVRLALIGSRGLAVTALWQAAIEKQKRNDFHEFEVLVKAVTKLQPNFITPWIFQSWNIAYNVSVEMHSLGDMYFYISRGIELLAEGERRNKRSPDMRYQIAFYYQNKFGVSDQVQTLRCLFNLSCVPPSERNPEPGNGLTNPDGSVDLVGFRRFCEKYPHLVRRLRGEERRDREAKPGSETLRCKTPGDVVEFLRANYRVPSRYKNATDLNDPDRQFPALPPKFDEGPDEANPGIDTRNTPDFSGFLAARAWFAYAQLLVPPHPRVPDGEPGWPLPPGTPFPAPTPRPGEYDPFRYRIPRMPMLIIFRQGGPRAQTYQADMMQKDGWFDADGWQVDALVDDNDAWFRRRSVGPDGREVLGEKEDVVVGQGTPWALVAWQKAADLWAAHGEQNGLVLDESRRQRLREFAGIPPGAGDAVNAPPEPAPGQMDDENFARWYRANFALHFYHLNRNVTNFAFYLASAQTESRIDEKGRPATLVARKTLWQADLLRRAGKPEAIDLYRDGLAQWKEVLLRNPSFHRPERFDRAEEETFEYELDYLRLLIQRIPPEFRDKANEVSRAIGGVVPFLPEPFPGADARPWRRPELLDELKWLVAEKYFSPFAEPIPANVGDDRAGTPWVRDSTRDAVLTRQGVQRRPASQPAPAPVSAPTGPAPRPDTPRPPDR